MIKCYSPQHTRRILERYRTQIDDISRKYRLPAALLRAVLYQEMTEIDLLDIAADLIVAAGAFHKKDSSTGFGQVFGATGVDAINFVIGRGLASPQDFGLAAGRTLNRDDPRDVRAVWRLLHRDPVKNIEIAAATLLCAAEEMTGRLDFAQYSPEELKLILTRYNANVRHITPYGEQVYKLYLIEQAKTKPAEP